MKKIITSFFVALLCINAFSADIPEGTALYLTPHTDWTQDGARFAAYYFGAEYTWVSMTLVADETDVYEATTPTGTWTNVIFCRMNGGNAENSWDNDVFWGGQTDDLVYDDINNHFTATGEPWSKKTTGVWSTYGTPTPPDPTVSLNIPTSIYLGNEINLSASAQNIENPIFIYSVKTPGSQTFVTATSPYTPSELGTYTFKVEVENETVSDEKEVLVKEFSLNGIVIGVKKPDDWDVISFFYWKTGNMGSFVQPVYKDGCYVYTFENTNEVNLIFVNGTDWPTDADDTARLGKQTINVEGIDESQCFEIIAATYEDGDSGWGKRRIRSMDCPFETENSLNYIEANIFMKIDGNMLTVNFDGSKQVELFTISGQLIKSEKADNQFNIHLDKAMYLFRLNGITYKIFIK